MVSVTDDKNPILRVQVLTTGGTIEKSYDEADGTLENRTSFIQREIIDRLRLPYNELVFHPLISKDSLHMTDEDRALISRTIATLATRGNPIVVLHGTDTMTLSAEQVQKDHGPLPVPVVFTGAMRPLGFENSDAVQNLTEALLACRLKPPGIYLAFHGRIFEVNAVQKNREKKTFEAI